MNVRGWMSDLVLGVRLAVGGGRTSWARLALSAVGIAIATAVLLVAASAGTMHQEREVRQYADFVQDAPVEGVDPTLTDRNYTEFRGDHVALTYVAATGPSSPKPAGLPELPAAGEMYASPALAELLASPEGELLLPRVPEKVAGTLPQGMVELPGDLVAWIGVDEKTLADIDAVPAYGFGSDPEAASLDPGLLALLLVGAVVLLLPVFIFVTSASRIAGAERDRRLSALRLVGSGSRQVRRIAAAESLAGAFVGLVLGAVVFVVARQFTDRIDLFGERAYVSDVVPDPVLTALIVLLIPALSVLTALFALRRTIIEPLGVVRQSKPVRRRLWWRLALIMLGVVLLTTQLGAADNSDTWAWAVSGGAALLLIGVPVLLPWLVERVAGQVSGGPTSWLLAVRRLQLDSGTSARVVGGVAVVLAGAITLQTVLMSVEGVVGLPGGEDAPPGAVEVSTSQELASAVSAEVAAADGVDAVHTLRYTSFYEASTTDNAWGAVVVDCAAVRDLVRVRDCTDGDVYLMRDEYQMPPEPGTALEQRDYQGTSNADLVVTGTWSVPADAKYFDRPDNSSVYATIVVTPGAIAAAALPQDESATVYAMVSHDLTSDQLEGIRNSVAAHRVGAHVYSFNTGPDLDDNQQTYVAIRTGLYAGSIFTLLLAGISLLVLALEHIRERRRTLAMLTASGVPRGVLGRSLLWQVALPIVLGVVVALLTGIGLAALVMRLTEDPMVVDWAGVALLCAGAIALSLLVSAMTMPFLRNATRLSALRTE
ncbi:ABC transporter permease [Actinophytocola algeriensis]|uniref:ABC-type lipoprotein release transport system permease subunit n=1 Tax=Actinophytocola algeriensis TaxID=1768010 RepID=A0A7W7QDS8_9PSEU|nr:ABC transporter permease [Actinophytocola algeriensis]MBB4911777.1 ABC-type lipoprotein release transport system permease subunit [Actinophytocola algeriensis]MBE1477731.1 ABC-type lipoprotein release transport system permease subunit [Actinophytocola algeriensis]